MDVGTTRDFTIGKRAYRDTLIARDVHQISNPATGWVFGNVIQIPPDGRKRGHYLAGLAREEHTMWNAAVLATHVQNPEPPTTSVPAVIPAPEPPLAPAHVAPTEPPPGWLTVKAAALAYNRPASTLAKMIRDGRIQAVRVPYKNQYGYVCYLPPTLTPIGDATLPGRPASRQPQPPAELPVAAVEVTTPEPKITIRPAQTKIRELEDRIAALEAGQQPPAPPSFWTRWFGGGAR